MISITRHLWIVFAAIVAAAVVADRRDRTPAHARDKVVYLVCSEIRGEATIVQRRSGAPDDAYSLLLCGRSARSPEESMRAFMFERRSAGASQAINFAGQ